MRAEKGVNWKGIRDRRGGDWRRMRGDFGEWFVREHLEGLGLSLERMERQAPGLPDFKVTGKPVMVEVKAHRVRRPAVWQKHGFASMAAIGWRVFVASPRVFRDWSGERVVCTGIDWFEFRQGRMLEVGEGEFRDSAGLIIPLIGQGKGETRGFPKGITQSTQPAP